MLTETRLDRYCCDADEFGIRGGIGTHESQSPEEAGRHIAHIAAQRWDLVLACNYSMYGNQPRAEHLLNFRRNLRLAQELCDAGVPAIPNLYWFRREDLDPQRPSARSHNDERILT